MGKLLRAELWRWAQHSWIWLLILLSAPLGLLGAFFGLEELYPQQWSVNPEPLLIVMALVCITAAAAVNYLTAQEHAEGTVRNQVTAGCRRAEIFLAQFLTALIFSALCGILMATGFAVCAWRVLGKLPYGGGIYLCGLLALIPTTVGGFAAAVGFTQRRAWAGIVICFIGIFLAFFLGSLSEGELKHGSEPYTVAIHYYDVDRFTTRFLPNPDYIGSPEREILICANAMNPALTVIKCSDYLRHTGLQIAFSSYNESLDPGSEEAYKQKLIAASLEEKRRELDGLYNCLAAFIILEGCIGWLFFRRRDLQ